jgi:hypothetical protein
MAREILAHTIDATLIIDDQQLARESYEETVGDADLTPVLEEGPVTTGIVDYCQNVRQGPATAVLCDQVLYHKNYAQFEGAEFVACCIREGLPAVLCTSYNELIDDVRPFRRWIPSLQRPDDMGPEEFVHGIEDCLYEIYHGFRAVREPWRTLVKVIDVEKDERRFFVEIPAWGATVVPLKFRNIPGEILNRLAPEFRCRAQVNLAAERLEDIYLCEWQLIP